MDTDNFKFDINAKRFRISNDELLSSLQEYAKQVNFRYFPTTEYDMWKDKICHSDTIVSRFGSWNKTLKILGIQGGHERNYSSEELISNLEKIWRELGYPPGKRQLSKYGEKISESPYKKIWGSVKNACEYLARFHNGKITKEELLKGNSGVNARETIPLNLRFKILKRDRYTCVKCGQSPAKNNSVELEIDHITPISKGGKNDVENLQTLCKKCNQGKKNKYNE